MEFQTLFNNPMSMEEGVELIKQALVDLLVRVDNIEKALNIFPEEDTTFLGELIAINGIGKESASDIICVFPTKDSLILALNKHQKIPFRNDIEVKLRKWLNL